MALVIGETRRSLHRPSVVSGADAGGRLRGVPAAGERFGLELGGAREEGPHLSGEHLRIAAAHRLHGFLAALAELAEQAALGRGLRGPRRGQQWNGVRLQVLGGAEPPQVRDQLVFVARRHQRRQQDHIRYLLIDRRNRGIARLDEDQLGLDQLADDALEDAALADVGFDCENERHLQMPSCQFPPTNSQLPRHSQFPTPKPLTQSAG